MKTTLVIQRLRSDKGIGMVWALACLGALLSLSLSMAQAQGICKVLDEDFKEGRYDGPCKAGLAEGVGKVVPNVAGGTSFEGNFVAGQRQGKGRVVFFNGDIYDGMWLNDKRSGTGVYLYGSGSPWSGDRYEGLWRDDNMHGAGTYRTTIGEVFSGVWQEGQRPGDPSAWSARRAAYMKAFLLELPKTQSHVCAAARPVAGTQGLATGFVKSSSDDRILVQPSTGGEPQWHNVVLWRPCAKKG
jgi:hypothetical protein